ncbi:glycoside hydrolase family 79 protein [Geosmithia morbida]|uniref:Glycoside hydrolase family 79 protein n=1 Tax=Geosmithia morbida TaxID=1094350 RepID=A0A9P4YWB1_9HYPO|nr:glycoside hydrolase family 79 protein [Geosmithia morbida]KAF4122863.1 glycoside hydrolase family 79 protein [Geosmithia morbida]
MSFRIGTSFLCQAVACLAAVKLSDINDGDASIQHHPSFSSISIETAFWQEFVGTAAEPNDLFFKLINHIADRGGEPILRPGGITQDSLIFDQDAEEDIVRTMGNNGEVYRTTVGPGYYGSWSSFAEGVGFISTLNFYNDSLQIAEDLAAASLKYQPDRIKYFELGNEPNNYPETRWNDSTSKYVTQWKQWTADIDAAAEQANNSRQIKWWASSATTDDTELRIRPVDLIPAGIDSEDQVGQFSIHSYVHNTCSSEGTELATIPNLLNHTEIITFADAEVLPSSQAAQAHGKEWVMGEFNSVACSGRPNVTDTFTQALWMIDTQLTYAVMNATSVYQHQGATLVLQSGSQTNTPGFSAYNLLYPRESEKYGEARVLPSFAGLLFLTEVFAESGTRVRQVAAPEGVDPDRFSGYALYKGSDARVTRLVLLNLNPYYGDASESDYTVQLDLSSYIRNSASVKRLTAPSVDEKDASNVTWAGQSFKYGDAEGETQQESVSGANIVSIRGSEAILVSLM